MSHSIEIFKKWHKFHNETGSYLAVDTHEKQSQVQFLIDIMTSD